MASSTKSTDFRWIHLPANNMAWVEALLTKAFIEEGAHDIESFKGLERSFNYQHRGQRMHSNFMRPLCHSTQRAPKFRDEYNDDLKTEDSLSPRILINGMSRDPPISPLPSPSPKLDGGGKPKKQRPGGGKIERVDSYSQDDSQSASHGKKGKRGSAGTPKGTAPKSGSIRRDRSPRPPLTLCKDKSPVDSNVCVFMPYLHFETAERRDKMQEAIQEAQTPSPGISRTPTRDELLLRAHLTSSTTSLHIRRTLDQFFYPNIDTQSRDQDQVVYRYQTQGSRTPEPKIFMVDQLWVWILGPSLIVTSFPQRWDQPKNDPLNVLDGIIEDINSKTREPVRSIFDLAIIITNRCSGVFDRHRLGDDEYQFLDMFESSIGIATDRETLLFNQFNRASAQASDWLKNHRKLSRFARHKEEQDVAKNLDKEDKKKKNGGGHDDEPLFVDNLLDIGQETDLLSEAKDIRDELNMIRTVLEHQKHVLFDFQEAVCDIYNNEQRSQHEVKKRFKEQQRTIDMHLKDIDRMDKQAERIYSSITDLLDLKQKHANAFEARFARDQAAGTTRQGKILMVFTIVTIVFLPLSFITSIFTINMPEFENRLDLPYVAKYTFGIGFGISIPLILLALASRRVREWVGKIQRTQKQSYSTIAQHKQDQLWERIPSQWRLSPSLIPPGMHSPAESVNNVQYDRVNVMDIPRSCGLLSPKDIDITENWDIKGLLSQIHSQKLTAKEVIEAFCKRAAIAHQLTRCLTEPLFESALQRAEKLDSHLRRTGTPVGPLHGLPVSIKDSFNIRGVDSSIGIAALALHPADTDAPLASLLQSLGAIIITKTNVPQTMGALDSANYLFGRTLNPRNRQLTVGGSTGGEGALIALHGSMIGFGTDIGGSIRIPAMCNGLYGFKPSHGRVPYGGQTDGQPKAKGRISIQAVAGPIARSVSDIDAVMTHLVPRAQWFGEDCIPGAWPSPLSSFNTRKSVTIGVLPSDGLVEPLPPITKVLTEVANALRRTPGVNIVNLPIPQALSKCQSLAGRLMGVDGGITMMDLLESTGEPLIPWLQGRTKRGRPLTLSQLLELQGQVSEIELELRRKLWMADSGTDQKVDAIILPVAPHPVPELDRYNAVGYTSSFVLLDYPAGVVPVRPFNEGDLESGRETSQSVIGGWDRANRELWDEKTVDRTVYLDSPLSVQVITPKQHDYELFQAMALIDSAIKTDRPKL
ncbi:amidase signature domain-containing protein [Aspergillus cavernicola]|uniref:Amidase signature domain-containing protein n=1 Tax=Aspergillus cavernicola TaxID=176166 RepID=A0ABR4I6L4_9EURO